MLASKPFTCEPNEPMARVRPGAPLPFSEVWRNECHASIVREIPTEPGNQIATSSRRIAPAPRLNERARAVMRLRHCSPRTEVAYLGWMRRIYEFHGRRNPAALGPEHVTAFLNLLATRGHIAASTQNQALAALLFLYRGELGVELPRLDDLVHAKTPARLPVVLSRDEVRAVLAQMRGQPRLLATLLYGRGLRLLECCRLRLKDLDFGRNQITVRRGKGDKDRATMLPLSIKPELSAHLGRVRAQHQRDSDIRTVQKLLGHKDVATTMIYTHGLNRGPAGVRSPADRLLGG